MLIVHQALHSTLHTLYFNWSLLYHYQESLIPLLHQEKQNLERLDHFPRVTQHNELPKLMFITTDSLGNALGGESWDFGGVMVRGS